MKLLVPVLLVALAAGQQFQQKQNTSPAVWVAKPGHFQQGGSNTFASRNNNNRFQSNNFRNQNEDSLSRNFNNVDSQIDRFQNQNQFQFSSDNQNEFQRREFFQRNNQFQNNQNNRAQFRSGSDSQFQPLRQNRFESNSFQKDQNRFQSPRFQQNQDRFQLNLQQNNQNRFQSNSFQQNDQNENRFQSSSFQQNNQDQFQGNENRFQNQFSNSNNFRSSDFQHSNRNFQNQNQQRGRFQQQEQSQFRSFENSGDSDEGSFEPLNLPSGARFLLGDDISTSFTCANRPYGYYADQDNSCRVFHVCNPYRFSSGEVQTHQYSFMCGEGTVFDQKELTCMKEYEATPCQQAANLYSRNEAFGRNEEF